MARPTKTGLDYFPLNVDFFEDEKIKYLRSEFGIKGEHIALRILMQIYSEGYYIAWDRDTAALFWRTHYGHTSGVSTKLLNSVVGRLVKSAFFTAEIFDQFGVLTSAGIQRRYLLGCSRRQSIKIVREFMVLDEHELEGRSNIVYLPYEKSQGKKINVNINGINVGINPVNVSKNPLNKSKLERMNESIGVNADKNRVNAGINTINASNNPFEIAPDGEWIEAEQAYLRNIGTMPMGIVEDDLHHYLERVGLRCFVLACEHTNLNNPVNKQTYLLAVLKDWANKGIDDVEAAKMNIALHKEENRRRFGPAKEEEKEEYVHFFGN